MLVKLKRYIRPLSHEIFTFTYWSTSCGQEEVFPARMLLEWLVCTCMAALVGCTYKIWAFWVFLIQEVQTPPRVGIQGYTLLTQLFWEWITNMLIQMVAKDYLFSFLLTPLPKKENLYDSTLWAKKNIFQFSLSIILCVIALAWLCIC